MSSEKKQPNLPFVVADGYSIIALISLLHESNTPGNSKNAHFTRPHDDSYRDLPMKEMRQQPLIPDERKRKYELTPYWRIHGNRRLRRNCKRD